MSRDIREATEDLKDKKRKKKRRKRTLRRLTTTLITLLLIIGAASLLALVHMVKNYDLEAVITVYEEDDSEEAAEEDEVYLVVPNLLGVPIDEAEEYAENCGFEVIVTESKSAEYDEGTVCDQNLDAYEETTETILKLVVSSGGKSSSASDSSSSSSSNSESASWSEGDIELPDLTGLYESRVKTTLENLGLNYKQIYVHTSDYGQWIVYDQEPSAGTMVSEGSTIVIYVSYGS